RLTSGISRATHAEKTVATVGGAVGRHLLHRDGDRVRRRRRVVHRLRGTRLADLHEPPAGGGGGWYSPPRRRPGGRHPAGRRPDRGRGLRGYQLTPSPGPVPCTSSPTSGSPTPSGGRSTKTSRASSSSTTTMSPRSTASATSRRRCASSRSSFAPQERRRVILAEKARRVRGKVAPVAGIRRVDAARPRRAGRHDTNRLAVWSAARLTQPG